MSSAGAAPGSLAGRRIGITADRRWQEQARLFETRGAEVVHGPTMRTIDLSQDAALRAATAAVVEQPPAWLVATTGMGMRMWFEAADGWGEGDRLRAALAHSRIVARGAKATSAVRASGLDVDWRAPQETMAEVVDYLVQHDLSGGVAIQLFDPDDHPATDTIAALAGKAGGAVVTVPVYQWLLPDDLGPARRLLDQALAGRLDAITFTSQPAVRFLFRIAAESGADGALRDVLNGPVLAACVGPVCAEAAIECGIARPRWPEPTRLPAMVKLVEAALGPRAG